MRDYYSADQNTPRLSTRRTELEATFDDGEFQTVTSLGYDDEKFKKAHRVQNFGFSSHPPKGSHGAVLTANGRPDQALVMGMEHPEYRPRDLPEGAAKLYDKDGTFVYLDAAGNLNVEAKKHVNVKSKTAKVDCSESIELDSPTIKLKGHIIIEGNIVQQGGITSSGVHKAAGHT